jgi:hypothetical protein
MQILVVCGFIAACVLYLVIGYFATSKLLERTIDRFSTPNSSYDNKPLSSSPTVEKGAEYAIVFLFMLIWPLHTTICGIVWLFWCIGKALRGLFWCIGKVAESIDSHKAQ